MESILEESCDSHDPGSKVADMPTQDMNSPSSRMKGMDSSSKSEDGRIHQEEKEERFPQNEEEAQLLPNKVTDVAKNSIPSEICVDDEEYGKGLNSITPDQKRLGMKEENNEENNEMKRTEVLSDCLDEENQKNNVDVLVENVNVNVNVNENENKNQKNTVIFQGKEEEEEEDENDRKVEEILSCLNGEDGVVDLWKLRQLALSKGGFISSTLRRRAWPKLACIHPMNSTDHPPAAVVTQEDKELIQNDINRSVWDVYFHMKQNRARQKRQEMEHPKEFTFQIHPESTYHTESDIISFTSDATFTSNDGTMTSLTSSNTTQNDTDTPTTHNTTRTDTNHNDDKFITNQKPSKKKKKYRSRKNTEKTYQIISSIITSVLECKVNSDIHSNTNISDTPDSSSWERLYYYQGFHDVTSLFLINLDSPSLTILLLRRLSQSHFRDAMRPNFDSISHLLSRVFKPLLYCVDPELHDYIFMESYVGPDCIFALSWILSWFSHDITDVQVASRLIDVFLASHMSMPIYIAAAILSHQRNVVFQTESDFAAIHVALTNLPKYEDQNSLKLREMMEEVIELAISYMEKYPPNYLVGRFIQKLDDKNSYLSILDDDDQEIRLTMLGESPNWCLASTEPTDWALIEELNSLRKNNEESLPLLTVKQQEKQIVGTEFVMRYSDKYENALIAAGLSLDIRTTKLRQQKKRKQKKQIVLLVVIASGFAAASVLSKHFPLLSTSRQVMNDSDGIILDQNSTIAAKNDTAHSDSTLTHGHSDGQENHIRSGKMTPLWNSLFLSINVKNDKKERVHGSKQEICNDKDDDECDNMVPSETLFHLRNHKKIEKKIDSKRHDTEESDRFHKDDHDLKSSEMPIENGNIHYQTSNEVNVPPNTRGHDPTKGKGKKNRQPIKKIVSRIRSFIQESLLNDAEVVLL